MLRQLCYTIMKEMNYINKILYSNNNVQFRNTRCVNILQPERYSGWIGFLVSPFAIALCGNLFSPLRQRPGRAKQLVVAATLSSSIDFLGWYHASKCAYTAAQCISSVCMRADKRTLGYTVVVVDTKARREKNRDGKWLARKACNPRIMCLSRAAP